MDKVIYNTTCRKCERGFSRKPNESITCPACRPVKDNSVSKPDEIEKIADLITCYCDSCPYAKTCLSQEGAYCQLGLEQATRIYEAGYRLPTKPSTANREKVARFISGFKDWDGARQSIKDGWLHKADQILSLTEPKMVMVRCPFCRIKFNV